ncbi:HipA family kinase [Brevibacillus massiliensis]|uniref:HipA family kinase n=2 Tax=Brevibacillus massiliensis TaxID=1118054 RepID=UPI0002F9427F|nr:HipA family kinase [Brevibacillus massiliensis]
MGTAKKWRLVRKYSRKCGPVWYVKSEEKRRAYFKYVNWGSILANELICYRLARLIKLKAAKIEPVEIEGKRGVVSIVRRARSLSSWNGLYRKLQGEILKHLKKPEQLLQTFVFDIWICNVDRHGGNLITYRKGKKLYDFYLIDHGLALLGAAKYRKTEWDSSYWEHVAKYNHHYVRGLRASIHSYEQLSPFVRQIQEIPSDKIKKIVEDVPSSLLSREKKEIVVTFLLNRQRNLHKIVKLWMEESKICKKKKRTKKREDISSAKRPVGDAGKAVVISEPPATEAVAGTVYHAAEPIQVTGEPGTAKPGTENPITENPSTAMPIHDLPAEEAIFAEADDDPFDYEMEEEAGDETVQ